MDPTPDDAPSPLAQSQATWAARFGWLGGGALGVLLGFVLTWWIETRWLHGRVGNPTATATTASGVLVPALFLVGALAGYATPPAPRACAALAAVCAARALTSDGVDPNEAVTRVARAVALALRA